ncbi:MAG TPA: inositol monophosphatase family protein [Balneolales bacterium]|nr:inositol monophosphatase family protein [Balneolales bacterium]
MEISIQEYIDRAVEFAHKGGEVTLKYFHRDIDIDFKSDRTPVTRADREAEQVIRDLVVKYYPDHGILGEEFGRHNSDSRFQWIIDPIDGTLSYIHGVPLYTTLVALVYDSEPVVGAIFAPATDELCVAGMGHGAWFNSVKCRVSDTQRLEDATLLTTDYRDINQHGFGENFDELMQKVYLTRSWGDAYGHMLVAAGRADIMFDPILNIWDAAALMPVVTEAGGSFTDVRGRAIIDGGSAISCTPKLVEQLKPFLFRDQNKTN